MHTARPRIPQIRRRLSAQNETVIKSFGQAGRTFHLSQHADIDSSPVQQSPEEGPCESAISEDICGLANGKGDLIVGSPSAERANPPESASGAKLCEYGINVQACITVNYVSNSEETCLSNSSPCPLALGTAPCPNLG
jgi:hypothetical protein